MTDMTRFRSITTAVAVLGALLTAGNASAADPLKIRSAWVSAPGTLIPLIMEDGYRNGAIAKHYGKSYTVESTLFRGSAPQISALAANEVDLIQLAFSSFVFTIENAKMEDIRVIGDIFQSGAGTYLSEAFMVRGEDASIKKVEDLKGKLLAVNAFGGALDIALQAMLKAHGLNKTDYNLVEVQIPNMVPALATKKVDLIGMGMPWMEEARQKLGARTLFTMKDSMGVAQEIMLAARAGFLEKNKAAMNDFFEDYVRGLHWFFDPANREAALAIIAKFNKRSAADYAGYVLTKKDYFRDPYAVPNVEALQKNIDQMRELGFSSQKIDAKRYVDLSFTEEAKKRIGVPVPAGWRD
jgi:NitT/TauT family transport system substrate-binding protein